MIVQDLKGRVSGRGLSLLPRLRTRPFSFDKSLSDNRNRSGSGFLFLRVFLDAKRQPLRSKTLYGVQVDPSMTQVICRGFVNAISDAVTPALARTQPIVGTYL